MLYSSRVFRFLGAILVLFIVQTTAAASPVVIADPRFEAMAAGTKAKMLANPAEAVAEAELARRYADHAPMGPQRNLMLATAAWLKGEAYTRTGENERAKPLVESAVTQARKFAPGSRLQADALLTRGSLRVADGKVAEAMADFHAAHDLFLSLNDPRGRARAFAQIAALYADANDWPNALKYLDQALDVFRADPGLAVSIRNGRGVALIASKRFDEAVVELNAALAITRQMNSPLLTATVLRNMARAELARGRLDAADKAISESIVLTKRFAPRSFYQRQIALAAQSAFQRRNYQTAAALITQAFAGTDLTKTTLGDRDSHKTAFEIYRALHRDDLALAHLIAFKRLDDEATELARSNSAALLGARFDFANQELRIANLKADDLQKSVAFERARARTQRIALLSGVGLTLLIIAMLAFGIVSLRRSRNKVRAANADLAETNSALGKALAAKTEFLATTSHEIRTPLNGILGMTQVMLADRKLDAATRDRVGVVHGAGVTMRALVDDILDVAKMETGNLTIEAVPFDLSRTIRDATLMWQDQASAKGVQFVVELDDAPGRIVGDPSRVRQIVFNLLSNALKFTAEGTITLTATQNGEGRYRIAVADSGIGIAPGKFEEIFESFKQADAGTTRQFGGTGLGLSICRNLARAMGGDVTVTSAVGEGAVFTLDLPLIPAEADAPADAEEATPAGALIVDRNPITRAMFKALLEARVGPVAVASDLAEAVRIVGDFPVARILIDDTTARAADDTMAAISELSDASGNAIIALLWRDTNEQQRAALHSCGVDLILTRPISKNALVAAICDETNVKTEAILVTQAA